MGFEEERRTLVSQLKTEGVIRSFEVERAMLKVPREEFVWPGDESRAYVDTPLSLSDTGQTISAPHMVAIMLELLELRPGLLVLEVGTGSGYNAALIAELISPGGKVVGVELLEKLVEFARSNLARTGYDERVQVIHGDGSLGYPIGEREVYDRICVTAASKSVPPRLIEQLKNGGTMLIPLGGAFAQRLVKVDKDRSGSVSQTALEWVSFVPLRGGG